MRFVKFLSMASFSLGTVALSSTAALAQGSTVPLKDISTATLITISSLSQTRLPVHKYISCSQVYQGGHHFYTDCRDTDGYTDYSNTVDYGWQQDQPACVISIEEPVVRIERNAGFLKTVLGSFLESDIKVDAGELLQIDGGLTSVGADSIELEAKAPDGNKVHIKCFDPEAKTSSLEAELSSVLQFRSVVVKVHAADDSVPAEAEPSRSSEVQAADTPSERAVESSENDSSDASDASSDSASSSELPSGSDAHPADGHASAPTIDSSDVISLERAH